MKTPHSVYIGLGVGSLILSLLWFARDIDEPRRIEAFRLVQIETPHAFTLITLGIVAIIAGLAAPRPSHVVAALTGLGFLLAALAQLEPDLIDVTIIGRSLSAASLFGGLGIGLLAAAATERLRTPD